MGEFRKSRNNMKFHRIITKILKILRSNQRIMKIIKNNKVPYDNYANRENIIMPYENYSNNENPKVPHENHKIKEFHVRVTQIIEVL